MQGEDLALTGDMTAQNIGARSVISLRAVVLLNVTVDPTIAPGIAAPLGSLALLSGSGAWQKTGAGATAWTPLGGGGGTVGPGTVNHVSKFTAANAVGDSQITDDGADINVHATGLLSLTAATGAELIGAAGLNLQGGNNAVLGATNAVLVQGGTTGTVQSAGPLALRSTGATVNIDALGSAMALTAASSVFVGAATTVTLQAVGSVLVDTQDIFNVAALGGVSILAQTLGSNVGISATEGNIELHSGVLGPGNLVLQANNGDASLLANTDITVSGGGLISVSTPADLNLTGNASVTMTAGAGTIDINSSGPLIVDSVAKTIISNAVGHPVGFYGAAGVAKQVGVPVTAAGIHAALVALGLIAP